MSQSPHQTVVIQQAPGTSGIAIAGLIFSILGWFTCGLLCIPGAFLCFLALFSRGPKGAAIAGLIVGFPGTLFFAFVGLGIIMGILGIGAAATDAVAEAERAIAEAQTQAQHQARDVPQTTPSDSASQQTEPTPPTDAMVRVIVRDDTENKPLHDKAEVWFRGHGSWWLKEDTKFGSAAKDLGRREVGVKFEGDDSIQLYPAGRDGQAINIPLMMTEEMNPDGSARDSIDIAISDNEIEIHGLPIKAATGNTTMKVQRGRNGLVDPANDSSVPIAAPPTAAEEEAARAGAADEMRSEAAEWRTWTTADGKYTVEARFVKAAFGTLTLEKEDGTTVDVRLDLLCPDDQDHVKRRRTKSR